MYIRSTIGILLLSCCMWQSGCEILNPEEELPFYIKINEPRVEVDPAEGFVAYAGVKDVWLEQGAEFIGVYRVPSVIPVFPKNPGNFTAIGGVFGSGLGSQRRPYPFWEPVQRVINAQPLDTVELDLVYSYYPPDTTVSFVFEEGFEGFLQMTKSPGTTVDLQRTGEDPFQGNGAGKAIIRPTDAEFEAVSIASFPLPRSGNNDIYAEVTYKNDFPFTVGLYYTGTSTGIINDGIFYNSGMQWNTIYVHFNNGVRRIPGDVEFRLFIRADNRAGTVGTIFLDNIRIVTFQ